MLTDDPLTETADPTVESAGPGPRMRRLQRRRRLVREELLAVAILLLVLAATVAVLVTQWLASGSSANPVGAPPPVSMSQPYGGAT